MKKSLSSLLVLSFVVLSDLVHAQITYQPAFNDISFNFPLEITNPNDGTERLFIVEQSGKIKVFPTKPTVVQSEVDTFIDLSSKVVFRSGQELGLLGLAFHPNFEDNGYFYAYYTSTAGGNPRINVARYSVSETNPNLADPNSELILFQFDKNQSNSNHNGGKIGFGPDGYLYISIGDGGGGNDPRRNAQNIDNVFGSICRIDVDIDGSNPIETNPTLPNGRYEIPSDNPFVNREGLDEIFVYGIRNTWKFSFDTPTGRMWGADVGQNAFEEINLIENGKNYGWNRFEGQDVANNVTINGPVQDPVLFYEQTNGDKSITGGYVYRGTKIKSTSPNINSKYIFGDYVSGRVWALDFNNASKKGIKTELFKTNGEFISSFGVDNSGELYFSDYGRNAKLFQLVDGIAATPGTALSGTGNWNTLGNGIAGGDVNTVATSSNGDVYHGGNFTRAGNIAVNNIAVYNENSGWRTLGTGTNGAINDIKIDTNGLVYIGGAFTEVNGVSANGVAVWNGTQWMPLGTGNEIEGIVQVLAIDNTNNVYAGGIFENLNGTLAQNIAKWNGNAWNTLTDTSTNETGTNNEIRSLAVDPVTNNLYLGGNFDLAGGVSANRIAVWNDTTNRWSTLGEGTSGFVEAIVATEDDVFVGGNFSIAGGLTVNRLARWNKSNQTWNAVDNGVDNLIQALAYDGTSLFVGGSFTLASFSDKDYIVNGVAKWDATNGWQSLGETEVGVDTKISSFAFDKTNINRLYSVGNFSNAGGQVANKTASWISTSSTLNVSDFQNKEDNIQVLTNPISNTIELEKKSDWELYNSTGQFLNKGTDHKIGVSNYATGIYYLIVNKAKTIKLIKL